MKKTILFLLLCGHMVLAQEENTEQVDFKNDIKVNVLYLISGIAELSYDYIINENSSTGFSASIAFAKNAGLRNELVANYRFYFGKKYASGFYAEAFGTLNTLDEYPSIIVFVGTEKVKETNFGLGASLGAKFVFKGRLILDTYLGVGRNFSELDWFKTAVRFGVVLGKRF